MAKHTIEFEISAKSTQLDAELAKSKKKLDDVNKSAQASISQGREAKSVLDNEKGLKALGGAGKDLSKIMRSEVATSLKSLKAGLAEIQQNAKAAARDIKSYTAAMEAATKANDTAAMKAAADGLSQAQSNLAAHGRAAAGLRGGIDELSPALQGSLSKMFSRVFGGGLSGVLGLASAGGAIIANTARTLEGQPRDRLDRMMAGRSGSDFAFSQALGGGLSADAYRRVNATVRENTDAMIGDFSVGMKLARGIFSGDTSSLGNAAGLAEMLSDKFSFGGTNLAMDGAKVYFGNLAGNDKDAAIQAAKGAAHAEAQKAATESDSVMTQIDAEWKAKAHMRRATGRQLNAFMGFSGGNAKWGWGGRFGNGMSEEENVGFASSLSGSLGSNAMMNAMYKDSTKYAKHWGGGAAGGIIGSIAMGMGNQVDLNGKNASANVDKKMENIFGKAFASGLSDPKFLTKFGEIVSGNTVTMGGGRINVEGISSLMSAMFGKEKGKITSYDIEATGKGIKGVNAEQVDGDMRNKVLNQRDAARALEGTGLSDEADRFYLAGLNATDLLSDKDDYFEALGKTPEQIKAIKSNYLRRSLSTRLTDNAHGSVDATRFIERAIGGASYDELMADKSGFARYSRSAQTRFKGMGLSKDERARASQIELMMLTGTNSGDLNKKDRELYKKMISSESATSGAGAAGQLDAMAAQMASAGAKLVKSLGNKEIDESMFRFRLSLEKVFWMIESKVLSPADQAGYVKTREGLFYEKEGRANPHAPPKTE